MAYDLYAPRPLFDEDHQAFRENVRSFLERHVQGHIEEWDEAGEVPRSIIDLAGEQGYFGINVPEEFGGGGVEDYRFRIAAIEEFQRVGATSLAATVATHSDIVLPYFLDMATPEQAARWLPKLASGEWICAVAMTEPGAGSDLRGIRATAVRDGDDWILNGSKIFITNGITADLVVVAARTEDGAGGLSLFVVEAGMPGFHRGRKLKKIGLKAQDTAELFFENVRVPASNLLGEIGKGLPALMSHLPMERLSIAAAAAGGARAAIAWTIDYVLNRQAFGAPIASFQNTQFELADMVTELEVTQAYLDDSVLRLNEGTLSAVDASKAKMWATESHKRIVDRCLQLFGGYGYMLEYPIARAYADTRVTTIYGGTSEIMKMIIARDVLGAR